MNGGETSLPIEQFVQALTTQLDRAQSAMAVKARNLNLPLTFAVKDLQLELRAHVEMVRSEVRIRPAGPGDPQSSMIHLSFTTITRPMIEENAIETVAAPDEPTLKEALGNELTDEEERRLEWAGVNTVRQLKDLDRRKGAEAIQRVAQLPIDRLRAALMRASQPQIASVTMQAPPDGADAPKDAPSRLRISGRNLLGKNGNPAVRIGGESVPVVHASDHELIIAPLAHQTQGDLVIETEPGLVVAAKITPPASAAKGGPA